MTVLVLINMSIAKTFAQCPSDPCLGSECPTRNQSLEPCSDLSGGLVEFQFGVTCSPSSLSGGGYIARVSRTFKCSVIGCIRGYAPQFFPDQICHCLRDPVTFICTQSHFNFPKLRFHSRVAKSCRFSAIAILTSEALDLCLQAKPLTIPRFKFDLFSVTYTSPLNRCAAFQAARFTSSTSSPSEAALNAASNAASPAISPRFCSYALTSNATR